jgi:hypothetical protein
VGDVSEAGSKGVSEGKTKGAIEAGVDKLSDYIAPGDEEPEDQEQEAGRPARGRQESRR